eukprot:RCo010618
MQGVYSAIFENVARRLRQSGLLVDEALASRVLGMVQATKGQYTAAFANMEVVGRSCGGQVQAVYTPDGTLKALHLAQAIADLPVYQRKRAVVAACAEAIEKGRAVMAEAEEHIYQHFLISVGTLLNRLEDPTETLLQAVTPKEGILEKQWEELPEEVRAQLEAERPAAVEARRRFQELFAAGSGGRFSGVFGNPEEEPWISAPTPLKTGRSQQRAILEDTPTEKASRGGGPASSRKAGPEAVRSLIDLLKEQK